MGMPRDDRLVIALALVAVVVRVQNPIDLGRCRGRGRWSRILPDPKSISTHREPSRTT